MKLGLCTDINSNNFENIKVAAECGYSYAELPAKSIAKLSHGGIKELKKKINSFGITAEAANGYFPNELKFVGDDVDVELIKNYAKSVSEKLSLFGIKTAVFGSGPSRAIPSGYSKEKAFWQIEQTLCIVNEESLNWGIEIVIEPLSPRETNVLNTVRETYDFCKKINLKNVHLLADLYHVGQERDLRRSMNDIVECGDELKHVHIACPIAGTVPMKCDGFDYSLFFSALKNANYCGNISVEAWPHTREALSDCKEIFDKYTAP